MGVNGDSSLKKWLGFGHCDQGPYTQVSWLASALWKLTGIPKMAGLWPFWARGPYTQTSAPVSALWELREFQL
ncbi:hypothetical protein ACPD8N_08910 [Lacticaseibacillus chiayiensis]|uniref:hypothetical protein n=1 Tax=Lacticaseibacillus chiayiensis TaxID=2100821 RepID=UPI003C76D285